MMLCVMWGTCPSDMLPDNTDQKVFVIVIMIVVLLSKRHRKDSSEAHTQVILFGMHMQCIVILTCWQSLLSAAGTIKCDI